MINKRICLQAWITRLMMDKRLQMDKWIKWIDALKERTNECKCMNEVTPCLTLQTAKLIVYFGISYNYTDIKRWMDLMFTRQKETPTWSSSMSFMALGGSMAPSMVVLLNTPLILLPILLIPNVSPRFDRFLRWWTEKYADTLRASNLHNPINTSHLFGLSSLKLLPLL